VTVRCFVLERGGLHLDVEHIDLANLANREADYVENVNARGELPALRLNDGSIITEITAICAYLDEIADGPSLFGATPEERAVTNMWTRRAYLEICSPVVTWYRGTDHARGYYKGHRLHAAETQGWMRAQADRGLSQFNNDLSDGRAFLCGNRISMADVLLTGFYSAMQPLAPWIDRPDLEHLTRWRSAMLERPSNSAMMRPLPAQIG
jgi:glutathione S-transferase